MDRLLKELDTNGARATGILLAVALVFYGFFLLIVGQPWMVVGSGGTSMQWHSAPPATLIIVGAVAILGGVLKRNLWITWMGFGWLLVFSALFLFGIGGVLLPPLGVLLVFLTLIQTQRILIAWGILTVLFAFSLYIRFDFAIPILSVAGLILMLITIARRYANRVV